MGILRDLLQHTDFYTWITGVFEALYNRLVSGSGTGTFTADPISDIVDATGCVLTATSTGRYYLYSQVPCYFLQGPSVVVGDVNVDEATPDVSNPLPEFTYIECVVTSLTVDHKFAMKTIAGGSSGVACLIKYGDL